MNVHPSLAIGQPIEKLDAIFTCCNCARSDGPLRRHLENLSGLSRQARRQCPARHRLRDPAWFDHRRHRSLRRRQIEPGPAHQRPGEADHGPRLRRRQRHLGARGPRLAAGAALDRHDLPALQPAVLAHRSRQRRAAAGDSPAGPRPISARAWPSCLRWSASPTSTTATRQSSPAARSSASALRGRWRRGRACCCRTRRPRRSIRRPRGRSSSCSRASTASWADHRADHPRDVRGQRQSRDRRGGDRCRPRRRERRGRSTSSPAPQHPNHAVLSWPTRSARHAAGVLASRIAAPPCPGGHGRDPRPALRGAAAGDSRWWRRLARDASASTSTILHGPIDEIGGQHVRLAGACVCLAAMSGGEVADAAQRFLALTTSIPSRRSSYVI